MNNEEQPKKIELSKDGLLYKLFPDTHAMYERAFNEIVNGWRRDNTQPEDFQEEEKK